jgi:uncharacterized membrane protein
MEETFQVLAEYVALALEAMSILIVATGGVEATWRLLRRHLRGGVAHGIRREAWLSMARWLLLGLEFMLAADVVRTAISPDWQAIGELAAIAVIRTFLNYFLERDLEAASRLAEAA